MEYNLLNDGISITTLTDYFTQDEISEIKLKVKELKQIYNNSEVYCKYMYESDTGEYPHDIPVEEKQERYNFIKNNNKKTIQRWNFFFEQNLQNYFDEISKKIYYKLYDLEINENFNQSTFTVYEEGDFIEPHKDGFNSERVCGMLIYLNELDEYNKQGGEFGFKTPAGIVGEVEPLFGNVVVIDFTKHNIDHYVNKVSGDFKRFAYIRFINKKSTI